MSGVLVGGNAIISFLVWPGATFRDSEWRGLETLGIAKMGGLVRRFDAIYRYFLLVRLRSPKLKLVKR